MTPRKPTTSPVPVSQVRVALVDFLGEERVHFDERLDDVLIASATSVSDVQGVLAVARQYRVPVLPKASGLAFQSIVAPEGGGILVDLNGMNRILEVNHSERYAVIEPGVTWRQLAMRLAEDGNDLSVPTATAPSRLSVWASSLMDGAGGMALAHGTLGELVWGVEAVMVDGEVVRTGSGSAGGGWWGRGPLPDLTGLFLGWRSSTGLVTRLAVSLRPRKRYQRRLIFPATTRRVAVAGGVRLSREGLFDESTILPWTLPRILMGVGGRMRRVPGEPESYLLVDFTADTLPELEYKRLRLAAALNRASRRGGAFDEPVTLRALASMSDRLTGLDDLPLRLVLRDRPEALTGIGVHGPTSKLVDAAQMVDDAFEAHELVPTVLVRPVHGAHFGVVHAFVTCEPGEGREEALANVRKAQARAMDALLGLGFLPHRFPAELGRAITTRMHPGSQRLAIRLQRLLDPEGILDPGHWGLARPA